MRATPDQPVWRTQLEHNMKWTLSNLLAHARHNAALRDRLAEDPRAVLLEYGIDPKPYNLPDRMSFLQMNRLIAQFAQGPDPNEPPMPLTPSPGPPTPVSVPRPAPPTPPVCAPVQTPVYGPPPRPRTTVRGTDSSDSNDSSSQSRVETAKNSQKRFCRKLLLRFTNIFPGQPCRPRK